MGAIRSKESLEGDGDKQNSWALAVREAEGGPD